ncbi:MAG TPA: DUF6518 family protein [Gaiellaceae bacterium]|jgi:hypothetical protein|nr:DUF6518 family protein [Gaiellaceae bacterium]
MSRARQLLLVLLAGVGFGVVAAVIKGQDTGARDVLGNLIAPWVVVPFLAGSRYASVWRATLVGVAATLAALLGFYVAEAAILDLGSHPWYTDLQLTLRAGRFWATWGLLSGAVYGALGGVWASRRNAAAAVAVGLAFVGEPLITTFTSRAGLWAGGALFHYSWIWVSEVLIGLGCIAFVVAQTRGRIVSRG